jgi:hypothetical protein
MCDTPEYLGQIARNLCLFCPGLRQQPDNIRAKEKSVKKRRTTISAAALVCDFFFFFGMMVWLVVSRFHSGMPAGIILAKKEMHRKP